MTSNTKFRGGSKEAPTEPFKRAVTACLRAIARQPELEVTFAAERPGLVARQGAAARAGAQDVEARCRDRARPCRFDRAAARLSRPQGAPQADAGQPAGARRVRGGRAGPRRGDRLAAHGRRRQEPHRHARRPVPSRQVRRDHRPRRRAAGGCAGADGARAADRPGAARGRRADRRSVAAAARGQDRRRGSTASIASPRTRRASATPCTISWMRSISATSATPTRTKTTSRTTSAKARRISPAPTARPTPMPPRR